MQMNPGIKAALYCCDHRALKDMFDPAVVFEENKLSDTVVEFKIAKAEILHPIYVLVLTILMSFTVWGLWVSRSNFYPP
jgi:hypothetical protein